MDKIELSLAGEAVWATVDRVLAWPSADTLFLADLHLGKDATFRRAGGWVPPGTTASDLGRLSRSLEEWNTRRLVILGDIFHSEHAAEPETLGEFEKWRAHHSALELVLIAGNHDRHARQLAKDLGLDLKKEGERLGPWRLHHHPAKTKGGYVLCGHIHPKVRLKSPSRESLDLPCFVAGQTQCLLPAYSEFTGGAVVRPTARERVVAIAGDTVIALSV